MKVTLNFWDKGGASAGKKLIVEADSIEDALASCVVPHYTYTITAYVKGWPIEEYNSSKQYTGLLGL